MTRPSANNHKFRIISSRAEDGPEVADPGAQLEQDAKEEIAARTMTLRWGREQVETVKRAAALTGVPYDAYVKQLAYRQALADIAQFAAIFQRQR